MKNKNLLHLCLFLSILLAPFTGNTQSEFKSGFIITLTQDTLHGVMQEKLTKYGFDLLFKNSLESELETVYEPMQVQQFYLSATNELYESHRIEIPAGTLVVFFRYLIKGKVDFYSFVDDRLIEHFYFKKEGLGLRELKVVSKEGIDQKSGQRYKKEVNTFRGELKLALKECPSIYPMIDDCKLLESELKKCFLQYYKCTDQAFIDYKKSKLAEKKAKIEFGLRAGINRGVVIDLAGKKTFIPTNGKQAGFFINSYMPRSRNRFSTEIGLSFYNLGAQDGSTIEDFINYVSVPIRIYRYFPLGPSRININVGIDANINVGEKLPAVTGGLGYDYRIKKTRISLLGNIHLGRRTFITTNLGVAF